MEKTKQFSKYGGVAAGSAATDYAIFSILLYLGSGPLVAQMTARIAGGVFSFFTNKYWSFDARGGNSLRTEGRRFLVLYAFSYVLSLVLLYTFVEHVGVGPYVGKIAADVICFLFNFLAMRSYVFSGKQGIRQAVRQLVERVGERR